MEIAQSQLGRGDLAEDILAASSVSQQECIAVTEPLEQSSRVVA
ncbi:MAG TPA: hypothetical protein VMF89_25185 [Polyangiales bacterium]|nr:hypothetical protein [Polyangiales bacterium]